MNWYKIAIRYYEDISREDYEEGQEGDESFEADQYFSIGQMQDEYDPDYDDEEPDPATCWIFYNGNIDTAVGGTHNMNWPHLMRNTWATGGNEYFRGWYDPNQNLVSVVMKRKPGDQRKFSEEDIPSRLANKLYKTFGDTIGVKVF